MINFSFQQIEYAEYIEEITTRDWIRNVISSEQKIEGEIHYVFCNDHELLSMNKSFLDHDTYTDIISFPSSEINNLISGEIYISIDRVVENAKSLKVSFGKELSRVIIHGILHFMGYDDHSPNEKKQMREKEDYYLNLQP